MAISQTEAFTLCSERCSTTPSMNLRPVTELSYHKTIRNKNGLVDFIEYKLDGDEPEYPPVHIKGEDFEVAFTHKDVSIGDRQEIE